MKDSYYFQHDYNARNDPKILMLRSEFGIEGYGVFWCLLETIAEDEDGSIDKKYLGGLSVGYGVAIDKLKNIVNYCIEIGLLKESKGFIYSERMNNHKEMRKSLSESGRLGALKRWGGHSTPNAKERKGKKKKVKSIPVVEDVISYFIEKGYTKESAIKAFNYYDANNWNDSQGKPVLSWKQKMNSVWFKDENLIHKKAQLSR